MATLRMQPPYEVPGTAEHAEYERLSREILHCLDFDRAGRIGDRLRELRGAPASVEVVVEAVEDMKVGDVRYAVPWALQVHGDGGYTILADHRVDAEPRGTVEMKVVRRVDGFAVDVRPCFRYAAPTWVVIGRGLRALPVVEVAGEVRLAEGGDVS